MPWNLHRFLIKFCLGCSLLRRHIPICRHGFVGHRKNQPRNSLPLDLTKKSSNTLNYMVRAGNQRSMKFSLTTCIHIVKTTPAFNPSVQLIARAAWFLAFFRRQGGQVFILNRILWRGRRGDRYDQVFILLIPCCPQGPSNAEVC